MFKKLKKKLKDQRGLTLIELLAVIVILGIIAAIAIPSITKIIENSKADAVKADAKLILNAAKLYQADGNEIDSTNGVGMDKLGSYIDDVNTFNYDNSVATDDAVVKIDGGQLKIFGIGKKDKVKVVFDGDTLADIDDATVTK